MNRLASVAVLILALPAAAQETTILLGGNILTMDADFTVVEAMALRGNEIMAVGSEADVRASTDESAVVTDLDGRTVMPGFIDAHTHPVIGSAVSVFENVGIDRFLSVEEALEHMKVAASNAKAAEWVLFVNLDLATQSFGEPALTRTHLDDIAPDTPMVVWHAGGHKMTVNSEMLELMGVTDDTPDPEGGQFGRFADDRPDGNLAGSALLFGALAKVDPYNNYDRLKGTMALAKDWAAKGITTLGIAGIFESADWEILTQLAADDEFPLRTRNYLQFGSLTTWDNAGIKPGDGDGKARVIGWKISADGSNQAFTGLQREPYLDSESLGLAYMSQSDIDFAVVEGTERGGQLAMHGNGNAAIDNIIEAVEKARTAGIEVVRPRIEHCSITEDDQIAKIGELGISCSFLIAHVLYWGEAFRDKVFGEEKAMKLDRTGSFERAGIPYSLHTDYGVSELSPLEMVEVAVTRTLYTEPDYVLGEEERASVEAALRAITSVPAFQLLSEDEVGSLEAGKLADFVVLSDDPRAVEPSEIGEIKVLETWMDGRRVH